MGDSENVGWSQLLHLIEKNPGISTSSTTTISNAVTDNSGKHSSRLRTMRVSVGSFVPEDDDDNDDRVPKDFIPCRGMRSHPRVIEVSLSDSNKVVVGDTAA